jgi:elongation factor P
MVDSKPFIVLRSDVNGSSRTGFTYKWKMKNLLTNAPFENVFRGDDKFDVVVLDKKEVTYSYFADPMYVFMDAEYNQYEVDGENMTEALNYLQDGMPCEVVFFEGKAISVELPTTLVREVTYTEPAVKGDTSGKVMKPAKIATGFEIPVPLFVDIGDKIEIDTRTGEYKSRSK